MVKLEVLCVETNNLLCLIDVDMTNATIEDVKRQVHIKTKIPLHRLSLRIEPSGPSLAENLPLTILGQCVSKIYAKDIGPQIPWKQALLLAHIGPIIIYLVVYFGYEHLFYMGEQVHKRKPLLPMILWVVHFTKRCLEILYVHRFSKRTMSMHALVRNIIYYWGFALIIAYHLNHPLYSPPSNINKYVGTFIFVFCEIGNLSIHLRLRDLRPPGTKQRAIPYPNNDIFTYLFKYVSFPNYTYEFSAWVGYSLIANCLYCNVFMFVGFIQMTSWAAAKHCRYQKEFDDYPPERKIIIPFFV